MGTYWHYLVYLIRHKFHVFVECSKLGVAWLGIIHDLSKFHPVEFIAAAYLFYGTQDQQENAKEAYDYSWLHHQHWNKHHWQHWILVQDEDRDKVLPMPDRYRRELLADWLGGWKAAPKGFVPPLTYYKANKSKMQFHPETRRWIEKELGFSR